MSEQSCPVAEPGVEAAVVEAEQWPPLRLVPDPLDELGERIVALSGRIASATCRWLLLVAQFDAAGGCLRFGFPSTARWLAHACGLTDRTATDHVRVARALAAHPRLADGMQAGRISYSHARAISRVARADESELVDDLVGVAEYGTVRQLESMVRGLRTARDGDEGVPPPDESLTFGWTSKSQWRLSARTDPEQGALVERAITELARHDGSTRVAALVRLAEIGLAALADDPDKVRPLRGDERAAVVVHLDAAKVTSPAEPTDDTPVDGSREPIAAPPTRPFARIADGPGLPTPVVERLLCAGRIRTALRDSSAPDAEVLNLGQSRRLVSDRQFRALLLRHERRCAHPGCRTKVRLQAHHVVHWLHGGRTDMNNLLLLCEHHHHTHHEGEFTVEALGRGRFRFHRADGVELLQHWDPSSLSDTDDPVETEHDQVADDAATTRWNGDRLDRDWAVAVVAQHLNPA